MLLAQAVILSTIVCPVRSKEHGSTDFIAKPFAKELFFGKKKQAMSWKAESFAVEKNKGEILARKKGGRFFGWARTYKDRRNM